MTDTPATVKVARDLSAIIELQTHLLAQAIHKAGARIDGHSLPGGEAMVALAHVADTGTNERRVELREQEHLATCMRLDHSRCWTGSEDEDDSEPVLQTLLFWSEQWRAEKGFPLDGRRPTVATEANVLRGLLEWAWDNELAWDDFARDVASARARLENLLVAGERAERGAPCLYEKCRGVRLVRKLEPYRDEDGYRSWRHGDWHCPKCHREWDKKRYASMVAAAHWSAQREDINGETWCSVKYASMHTGVAETTIRAWVAQTRAQERPVDATHPVVTACVISGRRLGFVRLSDVEARRDRPKRGAAA